MYFYYFCFDFAQIFGSFPELIQKLSPTQSASYFLYSGFVGRKISVKMSTDQIESLLSEQMSTVDSTNFPTE